MDIGKQSLSLLGLLKLLCHVLARVWCWGRALVHMAVERLLEGAVVLLS